MSELYTGGGMTHDEAVRFILNVLRAGDDASAALRQKAEQQAMEHEITALALLKASRPW